MEDQAITMDLDRLGMPTRRSSRPTSRSPLLEHSVKGTRQELVGAQDELYSRQATSRLAKHSASRPAYNPATEQDSSGLGNDRTAVLGQVVGGVVDDNPVMRAPELVGESGVGIESRKHPLSASRVWDGHNKAGMGRCCSLTSGVQPPSDTVESVTPGALVESFFFRLSVSAWSQILQLGGCGREFAEQRKCRLS